MTGISPKVGGCDIGYLVYDYALGMNGIVVSGKFTEKRANPHPRHAMGINWEWCVLYEDGELKGADTNDLQVINWIAVI